MAKVTKLRTSHGLHAALGYSRRGNVGGSVFELFYGLTIYIDQLLRLNDTSYTARYCRMSEEVNRKCPPRNTTVQHATHKTTRP